MHPKVEAALKQIPGKWILHRHADYGEIRSPADFAKALHFDVERISKTLFLRVHGAEVKFGLAVCPVTKKINLPYLATMLKSQWVELASALDMEETLGYPTYGVSPLGAGDMPVFMDEQLFNYPTLLIGAGVLGEEIEISPFDLQTLARAQRGTYCLK